jgi:hypothetical protein
MFEDVYCCLGLSVFVMWVQFSLFDFADETKANVGIPPDLVVPPFAIVASNRFDEVKPPRKMEITPSHTHGDCWLNVKPATSRRHWCTRPFSQLVFAACATPQ